MLRRAMGHHLILVLALTSLSTSPLWVRWAQAPLVSIGVGRLLGAGLVTIVWILLKSENFKVALANLRLASKSGWAWLTGFVFFLHLWTYMEAVQTTSVAHLVLIFSSSPIFTAVGSLLFYRDRLLPRFFLVYGLAIAGILLLFQDHSAASVSTLHGDLVALLSALLHSVYALLGKRARQQLDNWQFTSVLYLVSGTLFLVWALASNAPLLIPTSNFNLAILGLIIFPSLLGHSLYTYLLKHVNINFLSCAKLLEPGLSTLLAFLFLSETIGTQDVVAYGLIATAVVILFWRKKANPS